MNRRRTVVTILFCATLLALRPLYYSPKSDVRQPIVVQSHQSQHGDARTTGFKDADIANERRQELHLYKKYQVAAILLHWKRLVAIQRKIQHYIDTRLFTQIILWNNNPDIILTLDHLHLPNSSADSLIRIINSPNNLKDQAKYRACSLASTSACFYSDDDWDTSTYTHTLLASFRADPTVLHTITEPYTFYTNLVWTYFDASIDLHAGFTWIGCGSVFLRAHAQRHLQLLDQHLIGNESERRARVR